MAKRKVSKGKASSVFALLLALLLFGGCIGNCSGTNGPVDSTTSIDESSSTETPTVVESSSTAESEPACSEETSPGQDLVRSLDGQLPVYDGSASYVQVNGGTPSFSDADLASTAAWESYSPLDSLGRVGVAEACIGKELMPTSERESISDVTPSGWDQGEYDFVDGGWLYNRCHLIGYQLTGENANERNLMTGTRSMNMVMLDFESRVADYIDTIGNHVMYRVTPYFEGNNLVASGVQMEAMSVEDRGQGISLNVYVFNVEPGVAIDYATGANWADGTVAESSPAPAQSSGEIASAYVLNTNSMKIHRPGCPSVSKMSAKNREDVTATLDELLARGYTTCGNCF